MYSTTSVSAVSRQHLKVEAPALSCQASYESTAVVSLTMAAAAELYCCSWVVCGRQWQKCHVYISYGCYCYYLVDVRNRHYAALLSIHTYIHAYIHTCTYIPGLKLYCPLKILGRATRSDCCPIFRQLCTADRLPEVMAMRHEP